MQSNDDKRDDDDVIWLDDRFGVRVELIDVVMTDDRPTARAARLVILSRRDPQDPLVIPAEIPARAALDLAQFLMIAATVIDPAVVSRTIANAAAESRLRQAALDRATSGRTH